LQPIKGYSWSKKHCGGSYNKKVGWRCFKQVQVKLKDRDKMLGKASK